MSLLASLALAASISTLPHCSWDRPGVNPFMGDVVKAVDRYPDIPAAVRSRLKARMQSRSYDEIVSIKRDGIEGKHAYSSEIRDMHFGAGSVCSTVTRSKWTDKTEERGLVYCEDGHCILVPTVCRNVSRITRLAPKKVVEAPAQAVNLAQSTREADEPAETELITEPTGAGIPALGAGGSPTPPSFAQLSSLPVSEQGPGLIPGSNPRPGFPGPGLIPPTVTPNTVLTVPSAVPEPSSWLLLLLGLGTIAWKRRARLG